MMVNEPPKMGTAPPEWNDLVTKKEKRAISAAEKLLLPVVLAVAVLYDRLIFNELFSFSDHIPAMSGVFWLCFFGLFCAFYWKSLRRDHVSLYVAGCCVALCVWNFIFYRPGVNNAYATLTYLVLPAVLMAFAQYALGENTLKDVWGIAYGWLRGWFVRPFTGIYASLEALGSLMMGGKSSTARRAAIGLAVALPLLMVVVPLLHGADRVFGYYIDRLLSGFDIQKIFVHAIVIFLAFMFLYSFMWNCGINEKEKNKAASKISYSIDSLICCMALGAVCLVYVLFCAVQFTYLFAGAGLPGGMTYSEYAREGFAQTVAVCAVNLVIFGVSLRFGEKKKALTGLTAGLLGLTAVMLFSGLLRLRLYIDAYGLTWLRLLSAWFIVYLAAVIIICAARMLREKLPAIALSALLLLGWYAALGYSNPDALVSRYNQSHDYDQVDMTDARV